MTITVLTIEQIRNLGEEWSCFFPAVGYEDDCIRDIEQSVLQSPEIQALKKDAERYRFIQAKVYASNAYGRASWKFHYDNLPLPLDNPTKGSVKQHFEDAIDLAIRLEEEGNKCS